MRAFRVVREAASKQIEAFLITLPELFGYELQCELQLRSYQTGMSYKCFSVVVWKQHRMKELFSLKL